MAEVLIVVAIIVVLMGVGFIALMSHMRNMQKLEMDGQAKEIFVAAQNHLSMAKSQDYLGVAEYKKDGETTTSTGYFGIAEDANNGVYYIVVNNASAEGGKGDPLLAQMLPFASVNEAARTGGSYIIRYQKDPAQILDVFYVSTTGRYGLASGFKADDDHNDYEEKLKGFIAGTSDVDLKEYGETKAVVGYYGGGTAGIPAGEKLNAPGLEIINGDRLLVRVTNYNDDASNGGTNELVLIVKCNDDSVQFKLKGTDVYSGDRLDSTSSDGRTFTIVLDDVTTEGLHFANLMVTAAGSNLEVVARAYNNKLITNIAESPKLTTNSLFASYNESTKTVEIASIRHLLNLDTAISNMPEDVTKNISVAKQISDLVWDDGDATNKGSFLDNTHEADTQIYPYSSTGSPSAKGSYMPVNPPSDLEYQGQSGTNHITGIVVTGGSGDAGLFGSLNRGSVSNLELVDFDISASGNVGALVGSASGTEITSVLVHNSKIGGAEGTTDTAGADKEYQIVSTGAAAGGLVGKMDGGDVNTCAAAVYVDAKGDAGGLIGLASGTVDVESSYSGGHTEKAKYETLTPTVGTKTVVNVQSATGNAGGLIGHASGTLTVSYSYSTASASSKGGSVGIGGLVGKTDSAATIANCYAVGLVTAPADSTASISPFVVGSLSSASTGNYYLTGVSPMAVTPGEGVTAVSSGETSSSLILAEGARSDAVPYDATLAMNYKGKFFFPTVAQLHGSGWTGGEPGITDVHYGDWQIPSIAPLNYMLINGDTLDLIVELDASVTNLSFAVSGETSGVTRIYNLGLNLNTANNEWTITSVREYAEGEDGKLLENLAASTSIFDNRFSKYEEFAETGNANRRTVTRNGAEVTVYDVKITLDDIRGIKTHFAQLLANDNKFSDGNRAEYVRKLIPGENITVRLGSGDASWSDLETIKHFDELESADEKEAITDYADAYGLPEDYNYCASSDNSLFALSFKDDRSDIDKMSTAKISYIRHLQNLDTSTSCVNIEGIAEASRVTTAELTKPFDWNTEKVNYASIRNYNGAYSVSSAFNGIYNRYLSEFKGNNNTLKNFVIGTTSVGYAEALKFEESGEGAANLVTKNYGYNNAGLFRYVQNTLTIHDLCLENFVVSGKDNVGTVVASNDGSVTLRSVLVKGEYNVAAAEGNQVVGVSSTGMTTESNVGDAAAGGLVGCNRGGLIINNCASAVYVSSDGGPAGGLVGKHSSDSLQIINSYTGGHVGIEEWDEWDEEFVHVAKYYTKDDPIRMVEGESGSVPYMDEETHRVQRWNVISKSGAAGGLIGETVSGSTTSIEKSFNTASVYSKIANNGGGLVGVANGTFGDLELVYTVAPVYKIKTTSAGGDNGAVLGTHGTTGLTSESNPDVYYLTDIYPEAEISSEGSTLISNIEYIGSGTPTNMKLASFFAKKGDESANIIGILSDTYTQLEQKTSAYDKNLNTKKEFPFAIWTQFKFDTTTGQLYFYGDWQPVENDGTEKFTFYFMMEDPENALTKTKMPVKAFDGQSAIYQMAVQLEPFTGASISIPTMPFIPGYTYGYKPTATTADADMIAWTVYFGDKSSDLTADSYSITIDANGNHECTLDDPDPAKKKPLTTYNITYIGDSVEMEKEDLMYALEKGDGCITFVAHYTKIATQRTFKLMDVNDPAAEKLTYKNVGGIQLLESGKKLSEVAASLYIPKRSIADYRFLGWFSGTVNNDGTVTLGSDPIFAVNATTGLMECKSPDTVPDDDLILYAKYEAINTGHITMKFRLVDDKGTAATSDDTDTPLDVVFDLTYDKNVGFDEDVTLPGSDGKIQGVKVMKPGSTDPVPETEAKFKFKTGSNTYHDTVHITTGKLDPDSYPSEYTVYLKGALSSSGYAVVHVLSNTDAVDHIDYKKTLSQYPNITEDDIATIEGYKINTIQRVPTKYVASNNEVTHYSIPANNGKTGDDLIEVDYFFILTYTPDMYTLKFEYVGDSASDPDFWDRKIPYNADLTDYNGVNIVELEPDFGSHVFLGWVYKKTSDGTVLDEAPTTMPGFGLTMSAQWEKVRVGYKVAYWYEKPDGSGYDYLSTKTYSSVDTDHPHYGMDVVYADEFVYDWLNGNSPYRTHAVFENNSGKDPNGVRLDYDGSTVVNVYLKRKTYTITFKDTVPYHQYYKNNDDGNYGLVNGSYVSLGSPTVKWYDKDNNEYTTRYELVSQNNTSSPQVGIVAGIKVDLEYRASEIKYTYTSKIPTNVPNDDNEGVQYRKGKSGSYHQIYFNAQNGKWYKNFAYNAYSEEYTGTRYRYPEITYTGQLYRRYSSNNYSPTDDIGDIIDYYAKTGNGNKDGDYTKLTRTAVSKWTYEDNGEVVEYFGLRYKTTSNTSGELYGYFAGGGMRLITKKNVYTYGGSEYTGDRYSRSNDSSTKYVIRTVTKRYQEKINDQWVFDAGYKNGKVNHYPENYTSNDYYFVSSWTPVGSGIFTQRMLYQDIMPGENLTLEHTYGKHQEGYGYWAHDEDGAEKKETLNYYVRNLDDTGYTKYLDPGLIADYNFVTRAEDFFDINGFEQGEAKRTYKDYYGNTHEVNVTFGSSGTLEDGDVLSFYYTRRNYDLVKDVKGYAATTDRPKFEAPLSTYNTWPTRPQDKPESQYTFSGWYQDPGLENAFDFTKTMPAADVVIYGEWVHYPVTVTFNLNDPDTSEGSTAATMTAARTLEVRYGKSMGILDENGELLDAYKPTKPGWKFVGWNNGTVGEVYSRAFYETTTLTAQWVRDDSVTDATVKITYKDFVTGQEIPATALPAGARTSTEFHLEGDQVGEKIHVGDTFTITVPNNLTDYTRAGLPTSSILVSAKDDEIVLYYRKSGWDITVNYYAVYESVSHASWVDAAAESDSVTLEAAQVRSEGVLINTVTMHVNSEFGLISYQRPTVPNEDWTQAQIDMLALYRFEKFVYNSKNVYTSFVTVNQDASETLDIYLMPDADALPIDDYVTTYDGKTKRNYNPESMLLCPDGAESFLVVKYYYFAQAAGTEPAQYKVATNDNDVKNAATYGMRQYLYVTTGSKNYLIWQSDMGDSLNSTQTPPLHLYIRRRVVILESDSATESYYEGMCLTRNEQSNVKSKPGVEGMSTDDYAFGFADDEGAEYIFSANSFRRIPGKTYNEFTYRLKSNTEASNYNFFLRFGILEVTSGS